MQTVSCPLQLQYLMGAVFEEWRHVNLKSESVTHHSGDVSCASSASSASSVHLECLLGRQGCPWAIPRDRGQHVQQAQRTLPWHDTENYLHRMLHGNLKLPGAPIEDLYQDIYGADYAIGPGMPLYRKSDGTVTSDSRYGDYVGIATNDISSRGVVSILTAAEHTDSVMFNIKDSKADVKVNPRYLDQINQGHSGLTALKKYLSKDIIDVAWSIWRDNLYGPSDFGVLTDALIDAGLNDIEGDINHQDGLAAHHIMEHCRRPRMVWYNDACSMCGRTGILADGPMQSYRCVRCSRTWTMFSKVGNAHIKGCWLIRLIVGLSELSR